MAASESNRPGQGDNADELSETKANTQEDSDAMGATVIGNTGETDGGAPAADKKTQPAKSASKKKKVSQLGDFKLIKKLGQGGMGEVYLATQISLDRKVALKTLSKELAKKEDFVKRFIREARSMARLHHPNVVQIYAADSYKGVNYVAIEYIDGQSMQDWMDDQKQLSIGDALHVILVCAEALKQAHDKNMIHRDIKPDNILVTKKGIVKIADFGLAKALDEDVSMTQSGTGLGTPLYMAPEQARNAKHVDQRSDIYALGCTLYYFLTGELPFKGENTLELIMAKEKGTFAPARRNNPKVPERLDLMIDKMMAREPKHRYADCAEIIKDLGSLNLESPSLSFIEDAEEVSVPRMEAASRGQTTNVPPQRSSVAMSSAQDAAMTEAKQTVSAAEQKTWYIRHTSLQGKPTMSKMSTAQVLKGIKAGMFDLKSKAKPGTKGNFMPLAQFPEFSSVMGNLAAKESAEKKSTGMKDAFAKIDKQDRRRKRWRGLKKLVSNVKGGVGLIMYLTFVIAFFYGLYLAWIYRDRIMEMLNLG